LSADDDAPRLELTPRRVAVAVAFIALAVVALYFLLPRLTGLDDTWRRLEEGSPVWLAIALACTAGMFGGYVLAFHRVLGEGRLSWRESYQVTLAALAATRLLSAGGAGGLVLQAWALRRAGMEAREVSDRTVSFIVLTYLVYTLSLVVFGLALYLGVLPGEHPLAVTLLPALLAGLVTAAGLSLAFVPPNLPARVGGRWATKLATVPATLSAGMRDALARIRGRDAACAGTAAFWAFQIAVLWASFEAFGASPPVAVLVVGFFVGMLGNLLPLPGGVGGVDGGMIGAFAAFDVDSGLAIVAVLTFRAFTFWLPTIPGIVAYLRLRRTVETWGDRNVQRPGRTLSYTK
jgi:uncharacterized membrane protein YbhN (UPF0104 family)